MARGKVISVYLIDGAANGKIKATISNWNGIAYKIPRKLLDECKELDAFIREPNVISTHNSDKFIEMHKKSRHKLAPYEL